MKHLEYLSGRIAILNDKLTLIQSQVHTSLVDLYQTVGEADGYVDENTQMRISELRDGNQLTLYSNNNTYVVHARTPDYSKMEWARYEIDLGFNATITPFHFTLDSLEDEDNPDTMDQAFLAECEALFLYLDVEEIAYIPEEQSDNGYPYIVKRLK